MLLGGDPHLVAGLIFLGVVIAVCLRLLNWLFPAGPRQKPDRQEKKVIGPPHGSHRG